MAVAATVEVEEAVVFMVVGAEAASTAAEEVAASTVAGTVGATTAALAVVVSAVGAATLAATMAVDITAAEEAPLEGAGRSEVCVEACADRHSDALRMHPDHGPGKAEGGRGILRRAGIRLDPVAVRAWRDDRVVKDQEPWLEDPAWGARLADQAAWRHPILLSPTGGGTPLEVPGESVERAVGRLERR